MTKKTETDKKRTDPPGARLVRDDPFGCCAAAAADTAVITENRRQS